MNQSDLVQQAVPAELAGRELVLSNNRTVRIFVSSTFEDFKAEREALHETVFPELKKLCEANTFRFQVVDLRWGVSDEAALDQQAMNICLHEIQQCQKVSPQLNFIALLGDRYGWIPLPPQVESTEFEEILSKVEGDDKTLLAKWYILDTNAVPPEYVLPPRKEDIFEEVNYDSWCKTEKQLHEIFLYAINSLRWSANDKRRNKYLCSATHQEILAGVLEEPEKRGHVFAFLRDIQNLNSLPQGSCYADNGVTQAQALKETIKKTKGITPFSYPATWNGTELESDIKNFATQALASLTQFIQGEFRRQGKIDKLTREALAHKEFGASRCQLFFGRKQIRKDIDTYLQGNQDTPLIIYGPSGSGKSALMAKAFFDATGKYNSACIIQWFIGATPDSTDIGKLLKYLLEQITSFFESKTTTIPNEYKYLKEEFTNSLKLASKENPLFLFLDALDQLSSTENPHSLNWLPTPLPDYVKIVISVQEGENEIRKCFNSAKSKFPQSSLLRLEDMTAEECQYTLNTWLLEVYPDKKRTLSENQREYVLQRFYSYPNPLYMKLVFEEARRWKDYKGLSYGVKGVPGLASEVPGIVGNMLARLQDKKQHGKVLVETFLGLLSAARHGLSETEILDLLSRDDTVMADLKARSSRSPEAKSIPMIVWIRLYHDLSAYLLERSAHNIVLLDFYHQHMSEIVKQEYRSPKWHHCLARYFRSKADPKGDVTWSGGDNHALSELPYQQTNSGCMWDELEATLTNPCFAEAKCKAEMVYDLLNDLNYAETQKKIPAFSHVRHALSLELATILRDPDLTIQSFYNRLSWLDPLVYSLKKALEQARRILAARPYWICAEAPLPDSLDPGMFYLKFEYPMPVQSLSRNQDVILTMNNAGDVKIRELKTYILQDTITLSTNRATAIVQCPEWGDMAFLDQQGMVHTHFGKESFVGRPKENRLLFSPVHGILAVQQNNNLVFWLPRTSQMNIVASALPAPVIVLRISGDDKTVLYIAGYSQQQAGIAQWRDGFWIAQNMVVDASGIVDADLAEDGSFVLTLSRNRKLNMMRVSDGKIVAELRYESYEECMVRGAPVRCSLGRGGTQNNAYLATDQGQMACWDWQKGTLSRFEDYGPFSNLPRLVLFETLKTSDCLFYSTAQEGKVLDPDKMVKPKIGHQTTLSHCFIAKTGEIVSASSMDNDIHWYSPAGLKLLHQQTHPEITALNGYGDTDNALIGNKQGWAWVQPPERIGLPEKVSTPFTGEVVSLFAENGNSFIASDRLCRVLRIYLLDDLTEVLWRTQGEQRQKKILPAGPHGIYFSLYDTAFQGDHYMVLALVQKNHKEQIIFKIQEMLTDVAVDSQFQKICLTGRMVRVWEFKDSQWLPFCQGGEAATRVAFIGRENLIAVIVEDEGRHGLEVWQLGQGLPKMAEIDLPGRATCLATRDGAITIGLESGDLISLRLCGL